MKKAVDSFKRDLQKIRTGRANTSMLDGIKVDYYGTPTPVNQVATVQVVDARLITVKPWEKNMIAGDRQGDPRERPRHQPGRRLPSWCACRSRR